MPVHQRTRATKLNFGYFCAYYFKHSINYAFCDEHYEMIGDIHDLIDGTITDLVWIEYRESAKTWFARCFIIYCLVYHIDPYINADSYDKDNAEGLLFDAVLELQTNKKLLEDFGHIYNAPRSKDETTKKRIGDFITNPFRNQDGSIAQPGIRVEAHSTQEPVRGRQHNGVRPGILILDDFENYKTIDSEKVTEKIWEHIKEFKGGLDSLRGRKLYLCNYISQFANVQKLIDMAAINPKMRVRVVPVMRIEHGALVPTWPSKYVMTDLEAAEYRIKNPHLMPKVSLETRKKELWDINTGDMTWEAEMMCNPIDNSKAKFKREYFKNISLQDVLDRKLPCFVLIDPAVSEKDESDDTGVAIIWTDKDNNWYSKVFKIRLDSKDLLAFMFKIYLELKALGCAPRRIGVEEEKYYQAIFPFLKTAMAEYKNADGSIGLYLPMMPLKHEGRSKQDRITNALQYRYEVGHIWHVIGSLMGGLIPADNTDYETQAQRFPGALHDDMLDAHAYGADVVRYDMPDSEEEIKEKERKRTDPYNMDAFVQRQQEKAQGVSQYRSPYDDDDDDFDSDPIIP